MRVALTLIFHRPEETGPLWEPLALPRSGVEQDLRIPRRKTSSQAPVRSVIFLRNSSSVKPHSGDEFPLLLLHFPPLANNFFRVICLPVKPLLQILPLLPLFS